MSTLKGIMSGGVVAVAVVLAAVLVSLLPRETQEWIVPAALALFLGGFAITFAVMVWQMGPAVAKERDEAEGRESVTDDWPW